MTKKSLTQFITETINDRLKAALNKTEQEVKSNQKEDEIEDILEGNQIITTEDELQGYYIIRSIIAKNIPLERITHRDTQSYFGILLDDNNRKPICRLYLNGKKKYISTFDQQKKETKNLIEDLNDLYKYSDILLSTIDYYETQQK